MSMSGFSGQLSLVSLELPKLVGVSPESASKLGSAMVKLARDLQQAGSDLVIEEDLRGLFERFNLDERFAENFKERVRAVMKFEKLSDVLPLTIRGGPGPSVQRALQNPQYLSMVLHLSMFGALHEFDSLAETLSETMRDLAYERELSGSISSSPRLIKGAVQVCVEETSGFPWHLLVDAIAAKLRLPTYIPGRSRDRETLHPTNAADGFYDFSLSLLKTLMKLLPDMQRFPEQQLIIEGSRGVVAVILWAQFVLGLTVTTKGSPAGDCKFGEDKDASVIVQFETEGLRR